MILTIDEIDFARMHLDATVVVVGKRRTGKTTWAKQITQKLKGRIGRFMLIAGNKDVKSDWEGLMTQLYMTPKAYAEHSLLKLKEYQESRVSRYTSQKLEVPYRYRVCLVLDDCGSDVTLMKSEILRDIFANGRHYGMFTLLLVQYYYQIPRRCRENIDYLGLLRTSNTDNIKKIFTELVGRGNLSVFKYMVLACTDNYGMCFINNTVVKSDSITDHVFFKNSAPASSGPKIEHESVTQYGQTHDITPSPTTVHPKSPPPKLEHKLRYEFKDNRGTYLILKQLSCTQEAAEIDNVGSMEFEVC
jgi:hypothetical protein